MSKLLTQPDELKDETGETVKSLQRSLQLLTEIEDMERHIHEKLHIQGEQLDKINEDVTIIEQKQQESSILLTYMSGIWNLITAGFQDVLLTQPSYEQNQRPVKQAPVTNVSQQQKNKVPSPSVLLLSSSAEQHKAYVDSESLLEQISQSLSGLNIKANDIHETLVIHNEKLDTMNNRVEVANNNVTRLNKKIKTIT